MTEPGFSPEGLARTIAGREVRANRLDPVIGKLEKLSYEYELKKNFQTSDDARLENPPIEKEKRNSSQNLTFSDSIRKQAEKGVKAGVQSFGGEVQGEYEEQIKKAKTDEKKEQTQKYFADKFNPQKDIKKTMFGYIDAHDEIQYATPLETIHGLATVENQLFDSIRNQMTKSGEIKDPNNISAQEQQKIQEAIDRKVRSIGMTVLRGMVLPDRNLGQALVDKAISDARILLNNTNK